MELPNANQAVVEYKKIAEYLLCPTHPEGAGKSTFFHGLGFYVEEWELLTAEFRQLAAHTPVTNRVDSPHGEKYIIEGEINCPNGATARVRTIWIIDAENPFPRLVTAYPGKMGPNDD